MSTRTSTFSALLVAALGVGTILHYGWAERDETNRKAEVSCWWTPGVTAEVNYLMAGSPKTERVTDSGRSSPWRRKSTRVRVGDTVLLSISFPGQTYPHASQLRECTIRAGAARSVHKMPSFAPGAWSLAVQ